MPIIEQSTPDLKGDNFSVSMIPGLVGNVITVYDGGMTASSAVLQSATAVWTSADVGKYCLVKGAGPNSGCYLADYLESTIVSVESAHSVTLADIASTTVSDATVDYGTDCTALLQAAIVSAQATGQVLRIYRGRYVVTSPLAITEQLTIQLHNVFIRSKTSSVFLIQADNVIIDGIDRAQTQIIQVESTGNVVRVEPGHDFVAVRNCRLTAPPRWYDEANLDYGNAICTGEVNAGAHDSGHVYEKNIIDAGQNGIILLYQQHARISDNYFAVTDRTGSQRITEASFGELFGLSSVTLVQTRFCQVMANQFTDPVGMSNAVYCRQDSIEGLPTVADNTIANNQISGTFNIEGINTTMPRTVIDNNRMTLDLLPTRSRPDFPTVCVRVAGLATDSVVSGNRLTILPNPSNIGSGVLCYGYAAYGVIVGVQVANNKISVPSVGINMGDYTDGGHVENNSVTIVPNDYPESSRVGITITGNENGTNAAVIGNTVRGSTTGINLQGAHPGSAVKNNTIISPYSIGIVVQDGGGEDAIIAGNIVRSPVDYGVNVRATAIGPVRIGHNDITDAGISEYYYSNPALVFPEKHQDAKLKRLGIGMEPADLIDIRDDAGGSASLKVSGNNYRMLKLVAASPDPVSATACIYQGVAKGGTIDAPAAVGTSQETARLDGRIWDGDEEIAAAFVSLLGGLIEEQPWGQIDFWVRQLGSSLVRALIINSDLSLSLGNTLVKLLVYPGTPEGYYGAYPGSLCLDQTGNLWIKASGSGTNTGWMRLSGMIYSGAGSPEAVVTAPVGSLYLRTDGSYGRTLYVKESGSGNTGWSADAGTMFTVVAPSYNTLRLDFPFGINKDPEAGRDLDVNGTLMAGVYETGLNASLPVKTDAAKKLTAQAINLASATEVSGLLPIDAGGTGAGTAENARTALSVYSKAEIDDIVAYLAAANHTHPVDITSANGGDPPHAHQVTGDTGIEE